VGVRIHAPEFIGPARALERKALAGRRRKETLEHLIAVENKAVHPESTIANADVCHAVIRHGAHTEWTLLRTSSSA
jgi:hypothetical protein